MWDFTKKVAKSLVVGAVIGLTVWAGMYGLDKLAPSLLGSAFKGAIATPTYIASFFALIQAGAENIAPIVHKFLGDSPDSPAVSHDHGVEQQVAITNGVDVVQPDIDPHNIIDSILPATLPITDSFVAAYAADRKSQSIAELAEKPKASSHLEALQNKLSTELSQDNPR